MKTVTFEFEWQDIPGQGEPAIGATMADFAIRVGDEYVTQVHDKKARSVRNSVITPLYTVAEWLASQWWCLLDECESPTRSTDFANRHLLRVAERGFVLPDLLFRPDGESVCLEWRQRRTCFANVDFINSGSFDATVAMVRDELRDFIDAVVTRLDTCQIHDTWLQQEWDAINAADPDEEQFCRTAGRLGSDPYSLDESIAQAIQRGADSLTTSLWDDCHRAVHPNRLGDAIDWIEKGVVKFRSDLTPQEHLPGLLRDLRLQSTQRSPWDRGYEIAHSVRCALHLSDDQEFDVEENFPSGLGLTVSQTLPGLGLDCVELIRNGFVPRLVTTKTRPDSQRFLFARALMDCVMVHAEELQLLTVASTARQQQGRAFAAELLAPAKLIQNKIGSTTVSRDQIDDLSQELAVSTHVVEHQIRNHRLATIVSD